MADTAHIPAADFAGPLTDGQRQHLAKCPRCQQALADFVEKEALLSAPGHLKASILEESRAPGVSLVAGSNRLSVRLKFFYFSLKVASAVACSLLLLFLAPAAARRNGFETLEARQTARYEAAQEHWERQYERVEAFTQRLDGLFPLNRR